MILIELYVPSLDDKYDFLLDENIKTESIISEITGMLYKKTKTEGQFSDDNFLLCSLDQSKALSKQKTLFENGIKDGSCLILI